MEVVHQITKTKNLDPEYVLETIKEGLITAARKRFGDVENIRVNIDHREGEIYMVAIKTVVAFVEDPLREISLLEAQDIDDETEIGDEMEIELPLEEFGRNAIAATKQILIQRIREKEREQVYNEYKWSPVSSSILTKAPSSSTSPAPKPWCRIKSRFHANASVRVTAFAPSSPTCSPI